MTITAPATGSTFNPGDAISFAGTATDTEDGDLTAALVWTSSLDGVIGVGGSFTLNSLSSGVHSILAEVMDTGGEGGSDSVSLAVTLTPVTVAFSSIGGEDGWVRESNENSSVGGASSATGGGQRAIRAGDARRDRQYKAILSFDTSSVPGGATVISATVQVRRGRLTGTNPFTILGSLRADIQTGGFGGNSALVNSDFEAPATAIAVATLSPVSEDGEISMGTVNAAGLAAINLGGTTQFRLAFDIDDDDDGGNDYKGFFSGENGNSANHPQLVVTYQP